MELRLNNETTLMTISRQVIATKPPTTRVATVIFIETPRLFFILLRDDTTPHYVQNTPQ